MDTSKLVTIKRVFSQSEANILRGLLEDSGIAVMLMGEYANEVLPLDGPTPIRLRVREEDEQKARDILVAKFDKEEFKTESSKKGDPEKI